MVNGNGWKHLQWTIAGAALLGILTAGVTGWRQFTRFEEQMAYLLKLNDQQNQLFDTIKDSIRSLQQQSALQGQTDSVQREKLIEHDEYLKHILNRLRAVEQAMPKEDHRP